MMTSPVAGIDPHQDTFTVGIVDANGVAITHDTFDNTAARYLAAIGVLRAVVSAGSASKAPRVGARMSRSRSSRRGSTPGRSHHSDPRRNDALVGWRRPTPSTRLRLRVRCLPN